MVNDMTDWWSSLLRMLGFHLTTRSDRELDSEIDEAKRRLTDQERRLALYDELRVYRRGKQ